MSLGVTDTRVTIGERRFRMPSKLLMCQRLWLLECFAPLLSMDFSEEKMLTVMARHMNRVLSIVLIPEPMTNAEKARAGEAGLEELYVWLASSDDEAHYDAAMAALQDFFTQHPVWQLVKNLTELAGAMMGRRSTNSGSFSPPSPEATLVSSSQS